MSDRQTLQDSRSVTSLPGSVDGAEPCNSPDGPPTGLFGPEVAPVSRSPRRGSRKAKLTSDTCGHTSPGSSASVALQSCLESKLRALLVTAGSTEYVQTWRPLVTPAGRSYSGHTASARRTSDSGCSGWRTPRMRDHHPSGGHKNGSQDQVELAHQAQLAGWVTPSSRDWKDTPGMATTGTNPDGSTRTRVDMLPRQAAISGVTPSTSPVATAKRGALASDLPRWLRDSVIKLFPSVKG